MWSWTGLSLLSTKAKSLTASDIDPLIVEEARRNNIAIGEVSMSFR